MKDINQFSIVLLSAGVGRRIGKISKNKPKSLLRINGKSLIKRIILILKKKKIKELSIIVGFQSHQIINELKQFNDIKFNFIKIKNYRNNGHACSWHAFKKKWQILKKPIILLHTDIFFDERYLNNILSSKKQNIIGIHSNKKFYRPDSVVAKCKKNNQLESLNYLKNEKSFTGEVLGINKISKKTSEKLFLFMDKFLIKERKKLQWEFMLNFFIKKYSNFFYVLKNQTFFWTNVNYHKDYKNLVRKFKKN